MSETLRDEAERLSNETCTFYAKKYGNAGPYYLDGQHVSGLIHAALLKARNDALDEASVKVSNRGFPIAAGFILALKDQQQ